jgi:hypothetical protein
MKARYETRKCEIEQDAKLDKKDLAGMRRRLDRFLPTFFTQFRRSEARNNATTFVKGLLSDLKRKNVESIACRFKQKQRALQLFVGSGDWDHKIILNKIARKAANLFGEDDAILAFDPSGFEKDGKMSTGVQRQWLGRLGKIENGQVGTFLAYVTRNEHALVNAKLFIPQEWNDDPKRCEKAHIPKEEYETNKTRHEQVLEMLDESGPLLPHKWLTGDDEIGRASWLRKEFCNHNEKYVFAVPSNTSILDLDLVQENKGENDNLKFPKGKYYQVESWKDFIDDEDWIEIDVRDGEKHPMKMKLVTARVVARTEMTEERGADTEWLIVVARPEGSKIKYDYYLSNGDIRTTTKEFARVVFGAHRVED